MKHKRIRRRLQTRPTPLLGLIYCRCLSKRCLITGHTATHNVGIQRQYAFLLTFTTANSNKKRGAYDCQPGHQHHASGRPDQEKSHQLHQTPTLLHPTATEYLETRPHDYPDWVTEAEQSITTNNGHHIHCVSKNFTPFLFAL